MDADDAPAHANGNVRRLPGAAAAAGGSAGAGAAHCSTWKAASALAVLGVVLWTLASEGAGLRLPRQQLAGRRSCVDGFPRMPPAGRAARPWRVAQLGLFGSG